MMQSLRCLVLLSLFIHGETLTISSDWTTAAEIGKPVTLKCTFDSVDGSNPMVVWEKEGVEGDVYVHVYKENEHDFSKQHVNFMGRTVVDGNSINKGDASLILKNVNIWDEGTYKCSVSASNGYDTASVYLFVWAAAPIHIAWKSGADVLSCHSSGWYPAPTIDWSDKSGNSLKKDCETTLTPDNNGLLNVSYDLKQQHNSKNQYICSMKHKWMAERIRVAFSDGGNMIRLDDGNKLPDL